jgi:hypothetical protein
VAVYVQSYTWGERALQGNSECGNSPDWGMLVKRRADDILSSLKPDD